MNKSVLAIEDDQDVIGAMDDNLARLGMTGEYSPLEMVSLP